jgi:CRISPR/Cas system-associated exonuclease Cas4 (RecB family)|tara:strand:- start:2241 stop:3011 length:771 start_codon:yes stop_codon:yes gene_type:complete
MKEAASFRVRKSSLYDKKSDTPFKISRSKFSNFLSCKRCFYLDRVIGLKEPSMPGWSLNTTVDELLKKEFDQYRKTQKPHPMMIRHNLNFIPFQHEDLDVWRNSLKGGISYLDEKLNLVIHGGVDDIWFDLDNKKLIVVDYKAQSTNYPVSTHSYLNSEWHLSYKLQMDIYVHILRKMSFNVSDISYFYVCNGEKTNNQFENKMDFKSTLVPYKTDTSWIENKLKEMKEVLDLDVPPGVVPTCEKCAYLKGGKNYF